MNISCDIGSGELMGEVFVSYKAEDRERVRPLVEALEADGVSVWWDARIGAGGHWREVIEQQLEEAGCVLVIWSRRSVAPGGSFVKDEARRAQRRGIYLPVLIDRVEPPLGFGECQAASLRGWKGDRSDPRYLSILEGSRSIVSGRPTAMPAAQRPQYTRRMAMVGGAVVIAAGTFAGWRLFKSTAAEASDSIAVLPFDNLSGDPSQAYFSDGIAEELRSALARIPQLRVVARTSSEAVRNEDAQTAASKLGVANILTGSVRRSAATIRISAQLVDGRTGLERWSQDFDQSIGDTLAMQSVIAQSISDALRLQLAGSTKASLLEGGTRNPAAQDLYLKANLGRWVDTPESLQQSIEQLNAAIRLDPNFARAFAGLAWALSFYGAGWARSPSELAGDLNKATIAARRAVALAPNLAQGHGALGFTYKLQLKFKDALREMRTAMALPGTDSDTQGRFAVLLAQVGRSDEAQTAAERAISLDPLNPRPYEQQAMVLFLAHRFEAAADAARHSLKLNPSGTFVRGILGNSLLAMGREGEANSEYAKMPADSFQALTGKGLIAARTRNSKALGEATAQLRAVFGDSVNYELAEIYAQHGDADMAIAYLRKPVAQRDPGFIFILGDPFLDPIRNDPRFASIVRSLDFPT